MELATRELMGAIVVDSEGYVYGNVSKIDISPQGPIFKIKAAEKISDTFPDTEKLQKILIEEINQKGEENDLKIESIEGLYNYIANELDIRSITDKELVEFAEHRKIEIPKKQMVKEFEVERDHVNLNEVEAMNKNELGSCILLKISPELDRRGLPKLRMVGYQSEEELIGKLVIDNLGRILGIVHSFMMSVGGMRIKIAKESKETKLIPDVSALRRIFKDKKQQKILREMTGSSDPDELDDPKIISLAKSLDYEIPTSYASNKTCILYKSSVPWSHIKKIGDVVLLSRSPPEIYDELNHEETDEIPEVSEANYSNPTPLSDIEPKPSTSLRLGNGHGSLLIGIYVGSLSMAFLGLVSYFGAIICGGAAGLITGDWKKGALAGLVSGFLGAILSVIILPFLEQSGLFIFLETILTDPILHSLAANLQNISDPRQIIQATPIFVLSQGLINAVVALVSGAAFGFLRAKRMEND